MRRNNFQIKSLDNVIYDTQVISYSLASATVCRKLTAHNMVSNEKQYACLSEWVSEKEREGKKLTYASEDMAR